uniref:Uncharacterized protein n=1 Tax=Candidatus Kentrum sp. LPFa TaxID=2126335 RepID=A0A450WDF7_9GAMM|nr:MAG: hypothetical protein BECKLPF1236B_GA0070989_10725 [Candidatus Kentron sp. LPFa]
MLDVNKLRNGLTDYHQTLVDHRHKLSTIFQELVELQLTLQHTYGGIAAQEFNSSWEKTAEWFTQYLDQTARLQAHLGERIEHLRSL